MSVTDSVTPIYEITEPDENHLQNNPLNSTSEQLNMRNSSSIDLSKTKYNQDPEPPNAQTMNYATEHQQETYTNEFLILQTHNRTSMIFHITSKCLTHQRVIPTILIL